MSPRRFRAPLAGAAVLLAALSAGSISAQAADPRFHVPCPLADGVEGYPVTVRAADGSTLDRAYAERLASAIAYRWLPPSPRRRTFPDLRRVRSRIIAPSPRWPDDWRPSEQHVARLAITMKANGAGDPEMLSGLQDRAFQRTLREIFTEDPTGQHPLPPLPAGANSVRVIVGFGMAPAAEDVGTVRFAAQQTPVRVLPLTLRRVEGTRSMQSVGRPFATVKYDVDSSGRIDMGSIQVLESSNSDFARIAIEALRQGGFTPAQHDCRPIPLSVVQNFGNR